MEAQVTKLQFLHGSARSRVQARRLMRTFLRAFEQSCGNVSVSCHYAGISRQTFYRWKRGARPIDKWFQRRLEQIKPLERKVDLAEMKLMELIEAGNTRAIIYALRTQGRDRGWGNGVLPGKEKKDLTLRLLAMAVDTIEANCGVTPTPSLRVFWDLRLAEAFGVPPLEVLGFRRRISHKENVSSSTQ